MFSETELQEIISAIRAYTAKEYAKGTRDRIVHKCKEALKELEDTTNKEFMTGCHTETHRELY